MTSSIIARDKSQTGFTAATGPAEPTSYWNYVKSPWTPTLLFGAAVIKEIITYNKNNGLPSLTNFKSTFMKQPKLLLGTSVLLFGSMVYSYYAPSIYSLYIDMKGRYYDEKKVIP